jgi:hypothetical protein
MTTITDLSHSLQGFFTEQANNYAIETGFVKRRRELTGAAFLQALVFSQLAHPKPSYQQVHHFLVYTGTKMTCQALDKHFNPEALVFVNKMLAQALSEAFFASSKGLKTLLDCFEGVYLFDGTRLKSGEKLLTGLNLSTGQIQIEIVDAKVHDNAVALVHQPLPKGALRLTDLGFFDLKAFAKLHQTGAYWLSRYKSRTVLLCSKTQQRLELLTLLQGQSELCLPVLVGLKEPLAAQFLARPVPELEAQKRLSRLAARAKRKQQAFSPLVEKLAAWDLLLSNIPALNFEDYFRLAQARWQIELVFKLWKSFFALEAETTQDPIRRACLRSSKLLMLWVAHLLFSLDPELNRSWWQAGQTLRDHALYAIHALKSPSAWGFFLENLASTLPLTSRLSRRLQHPLTFQLLELDP